MKALLKKSIGSIPLIGKLILENARKYKIWFKYIYPIKKRYFFNRKTWFFLYTPTHGNLGDHAIAIASEQLFKRLKIAYYEVTYTKLCEYQSMGILSAFDKCNLVLNGGGNLGTLWIDCEHLTRDIIQNNPNSKIIILPNSFYYENTEMGQKELNESIRIYNEHNKLYIFARERLSFEAMSRIYKNVFLVPDMVFSFDFPVDDSIKREGILVCLRNDIERTLSESDRIELEKILIATSLKISITDTVLTHNVTPGDRRKEVLKKLNEFNKAQLVITDRLHGMIFSAITGTPCIVLNSKSPKVKGCLAWVRECDYIKYADDIEVIPNLITEIITKKYKRFVVSETQYSEVCSCLSDQ